MERVGIMSEKTPSALINCSKSILILGTNIVEEKTKKSKDQMKRQIIQWNDLCSQESEGKQTLWKSLS